VQFAITDCVALVREVADHQVRFSFDYVHGTKKIIEKCFYVPGTCALHTALNRFMPIFLTCIFLHGLGI
jgi:hypothetical protein